MIHLLRNVFFISLLTLAGYVQAATQPDKVIARSYDSLLQLIESKQLVAGMSEQALVFLMEKELAPIVDFQRISRKVMGKYARQASDTQLERFTAAFKTTLVSTYSKGLDKLDLLDRVDIGEPLFDDKRRLSKVPMTIYLKDGVSYSLVYSMFLSKGDRWLVENIVVEGVNIGLVMRNQFASYMDQYGDIDAAIDHWGS